MFLTQAAPCGVLGLVPAGPNIRDALLTPHPDNTPQPWSDPSFGMILGGFSPAGSPVWLSMSSGGWATLWKQTLRMLLLTLPEPSGPREEGANFPF